MQVKVDSELTFEERWQAAKLQAQIPDSMRESFFDKCGHMPLSPVNKRQYNRYFLRVKAIIEYRNEVFGCYTMDLSRQGMGLLSPISLERAEQIQLHLRQGTRYVLETTRCQQIDEHCYECGGRFVL
jgi:PilZ domain